MLLESTVKCPWFQPSAAMLMRSALFWGVTQSRVVIFYRLFGTTYRSHIQGSRSPRRKKYPQKSADLNGEVLKNLFKTASFTSCMNLLQQEHALLQRNVIEKMINTVMPNKV
jgi:hypothetical protein